MPNIEMTSAEFRRAAGMTSERKAVTTDEAKKLAKRAERERLEDAFNAAWLQVGCGLPLPETQFRFAPPRRWRFDFAFPSVKLAVEIQGGTWIKSGHTSGRTREAAYERMNAAQIAGWTVLQYGTDAMENPMAVATEVAAALRAKLTRTA